MLRIELNDPEVNCLGLGRAGTSDERSRMRIGDILGQNTNVSELSIWHGNPDGAGLAAGLHNNRCIEVLNIMRINLRGAWPYFLGTITAQRYHYL